MDDQPPIFVIHMRSAKERRQIVINSYATKWLRFDFINAVNGHDDDEIKRYEKFLPESFWGEPAIKPGAFGCFLSHRKAWRRIVKEDLPFALITEDDAVPTEDFFKRWSRIENALEKADIIWVNERAAKWAEKPFHQISAMLRDNAEAIDASTSVAPGGDGYLLTNKAARKLLRLSGKIGAVCGIDWFLFGLCWDRSEIAAPTGREEFGKLVEILGKEPAKLKGKVSKFVLVEQTSVPSTIIHSKTEPIDDLRARLLG